MIGKKGSILLVLKVLEEHSDRQNPLTQKEIIDHIKQTYGVELERKSVASSLKILADEFDYDINKSAGGGFYLDQRLFEPSEVTFLTNAIFSSKVINGNFANQLSKKVLSVLSEKYRNNYKYVYKCLEVSRTKDNDLFYNIDVISHALRHHRQIKFKYLTYDENGNLTPRKRHNGTYDYVVTPFYMINSRGMCYLLSVMMDKERNEITPFRLDYLKDVEELKEPAIEISSIKRYQKGFDIAKYINNHIYMFGSDNPITAKLLLKQSSAAKYVKEWFNDNARVEKKDGKLIATIHADLNTLFFWVMQYSEHLTVLAPDELKTRMKKAAEQIIKDLA